jgi:anaerobic selenocysteine-containing dehydrogenase
MTNHRTHTCMLCEAMCGLDLEMADDASSILHVRADKQDPFSRGHICPKALAIEDVRLDPDRVLTPLRRGKNGFSRIGWDEAIDEATSRIHELQARYGKKAVALYAGNPTVHSFGAMLGMLTLGSALDGHSNFSATSVDQLPHQLNAFQMFGNQALMPVPDVDRTQFMLIIGANPLVSNGSIMSAPGIAERLQALRARGGRLVVVDPRRTETAAVADTHLAISPGTDALFLLALANVIIHENLSRPGRLAAFTDGLERLSALTAPFTPEAVAPVIDLDASAVRTLAREFAQAQSAVAYGRMGLCTQSTGGTSAWLLCVLNLITGNLDRVGGSMFTTPAVDLAALAKRVGKPGSHNRFQSRVRGLPESAGELPVSVMAEEMDTPGEGQIRALITVAGNPALSTPNGPRLERALEKLDFVLSFDLYRNETTRHAHLILPTSFGFERDHYDIVFNMLAVRNNAKFAEAIFPAAGETREDFELLSAFAASLAKRRKGVKAKATALALTAMHKVGSRRLLDGLLRIGPHRLSLAALQRAPHGVDLGPLVPRLPDVLGTKSQRIAAVPEIYARDLLRLAVMLHAPRRTGLMLIGRRLLRSNNSWMHNSERLTKGRTACTLLIHPQDAAARGVVAGAEVHVRSAAGQVTAEAELSDTMKRGVVSLPHGYGHTRPDVPLQVASRRAGVSLNDVTLGAVDPVSGNAALNGIEVDVELAVATHVAAPEHRIEA